eukprot:1159455-Pelagomonas_calceolata.AAC.1
MSPFLELQTLQFETKTPPGRLVVLHASLLCHNDYNHNCCIKPAAGLHTGCSRLLSPAKGRARPSYA